MKKLFISLFIILLLTACSNNKQDTKEEFQSLVQGSSMITFAEYTKTIKRVKLPTSLTCDIEPKGNKFSIPQSVIDNYGKNNATILGKIIDSPYLKAIIYLSPSDITLPILITYDKSGQKISELPLYEKFCGEDEFSSGKSWVSIDRSLNIILKDSAITYERDKKGVIIESSKSSVINIKKYIITDIGTIEEKEEEI